MLDSELEKGGGNRGGRVTARFDSTLYHSDCGKPGNNLRIGVLFTINNVARAEHFFPLGYPHSDDSECSGCAVFHN